MLEENMFCCYVTFMSLFALCFYYCDWISSFSIGQHDFVGDIGLGK